MPGFCVSVRSGLCFEWPEGFTSRDVKAVQSFVCAPEVWGFSLGCCRAEGAER